MAIVPGKTNELNRFIHPTFREFIVPLLFKATQKINNTLSLIITIFKQSFFWSYLKLLTLKRNGQQFPGRNDIPRVNGSIIKSQVFYIEVSNMCVYTICKWKQRGDSYRTCITVLCIGILVFWTHEINIIY